MANIDRPSGFRPVGHLSGGGFTGRVRKYYSVNDNLFLGDLVEKEATGTASGSGGYPGVDRMDSGTADILVGCVVGWEINPDSLNAMHHAASSTLAVYINDDPMTIYEGQCDGTLAVTDIGLNADVTIGSGSTTTGASNMEIAASGAAATQATPLKIMGLVEREDNDVASANANWLVMLNLHAYKNEAGTTGI
tara:strand:- start:37 stop:615 length:579 start_codon:yes stop_codon:yes gene_type:complete